MATKLILGTNDLLTCNPNLAAEWDYDKNEGLRPEKFTSGSSKKMWWIGACGHGWCATIASRNAGSGCPICARNKNGAKVRENAIKTNGTLVETYPTLIKDWDFDKNLEFDPEKVSPKSHEIVWWKCHVCGYEWEAVIRNRVSSDKCPNCTKRVRNVIKEKRAFISLTIGNPDVASEWHPTKNGLLTPNDLSVSSHRVVWWKCKKSHEWEASLNNRTSKGRGCPYCCNNPRVLSGVNDLSTICPELAKEWNYEKNGELTPGKVTASSSKSVWWKCEKGHEWKTTVNHRRDGSGCPKCTMSRQTSFPEQAVFYYVSKAYPDAVSGYTELFNNHGMELDVYIPSLKIGIEYDGAKYHQTVTQKQRELKKYDICKKKEITLIRVKEAQDDNKNNCDYSVAVNENLNDAIMQLNSFGIRVAEVNVERDRNLIEACYRNNLKDNSLLSKYPSIAAEWDLIKNAPLTPDLFLPKSNRLAWWKCKLGHSWKAKIDARVRGTGCPYCSNSKVLPGFNDFATKRPDLLAEWDFDKNDGIQPESITPGSGKKVWWICKSGHSWKAEISSRNKGHGCPYCAGNRV